MTRYHDYRREILGEADFTLFVETVTLEQMNAFRDYVVNEYKLRQEHPDFYAPRMLINHRPRPLSGTYFYMNKKEKQRKRQRYC